MTETIRRFIKGAGSVIDIAPNTDYHRFVPKGTSAERIGRHWERVGNHLRVSINRLSNEQKKKK